jgi:hypothetical protein
LDCGQSDLAIELAESMVNQCPDLVVYREHWAQALWHQERYTEVRRVLELARAIALLSPYALLMLVHSSASLGHRKVALEQMRDFCSSNKTNTRRLKMKIFATAAILTALLSSMTNQALAHFPFLTTNDQGEVVLFFGENLANRTYKIPLALEKAEVRRIDRDGQATPMETKAVETESFKGMATVASLKPGEAAVTQIRYGVYHGSLLDYYCIHLACLIPIGDQPKPTKTDFPLDAQVVSTDQGIEVVVTFQGTPVKSAKVSLSCSEGHVEAEEKTDSQGVVRFANSQVETGMNSLLIGHQVKVSGEWKEQKYETGSHYLTITFPQESR